MADHRGDRSGRLIAQWAAFGLLGIAVAGVGVLSYQGWGRTTTLEATARTLAQQVYDLGATPRALPPGMAGPDGLAGRDGRDGRDGVNGQTPACVNEPAQCRGPAGTNGIDGRTPPCATEPGQCQGTDGRNGRDGEPCTPPFVLRTGHVGAEDEGTYTRAIVCVDPGSYTPPSSSVTTIPPTTTGATPTPDVSVVVQGGN
jgi:hypothetical protein